MTDQEMLPDGLLVTLTHLRTSSALYPDRRNKVACLLSEISWLQSRGVHRLIYAIIVQAIAASSSVIAVRALIIGGEDLEKLSRPREFCQKVFRHRFIHLDVRPSLFWYRQNCRRARGDSLQPSVSADNETRNHMVSRTSPRRQVAEP